MRISECFIASVVSTGTGIGTHLEAFSAYGSVYGCKFAISLGPSQYLVSGHIPALMGVGVGLFLLFTLCFL
jgi:hypothetical protein